MEAIVGTRCTDITLAERYDTGLMLTLSIVEDVFQSQCIGSGSILIIVLLVNKYSIGGDGIAHHADVAVEGNTSVGRIISAASTSACCMGTMSLYLAVCRAAMFQQCGFGGILTAYG